MIKITEKQLLFFVINIMAWLSVFFYMLLDFIAALTMIMITNDPQYAVVELGVYLIRGAAGILFGCEMVIVVLMDCWMVSKAIREYREQYWRENL